MRRRARGPRTASGAAGPIARGYASVVVRLRWAIALAWVAGAIAALAYLPAPATQDGQGVGDLVAADAPAVRAEADALRSFAVPLLGRVMVVQRDPKGLSADAQQRAVERAVAIDSSRNPCLGDQSPARSRC